MPASLAHTGYAVVVTRSRIAPRQRPRFLANQVLSRAVARVRLREIKGAGNEARLARVRMVECIKKPAELPAG